MYQSSRSVKSTARKLATGLTVQKATRDARRIVERVMPGVGATVTSRISWDSDSNRQTVVTTITHPTDHADAFALWTALFALPNVLRNGSRDSARIVITRTV